MRLPVKGAFHSPLMETVQDAMRELTSDLHWHDPVTPLVANVSGRVLTRGAEVRQELIEQITNRELPPETQQKLKQGIEEFKSRFGKG